MADKLSDQQILEMRTRLRENEMLLQSLETGLLSIKAAGFSKEVGMIKGRLDFLENLCCKQPWFRLRLNARVPSNSNATMDEYMRHTIYFKFYAGCAAGCLRCVAGQLSDPLRGFDINRRSHITGPTAMDFALSGKTYGKRIGAQYDEVIALLEEHGCKRAKNL